MKTQWKYQGFIFNSELYIKKEAYSLHMINCGCMHLGMSIYLLQHSCPHHFLSHLLHMRTKISALIEKFGRGNPFTWGLSHIKEDYIWGWNRPQWAQHLCGNIALSIIFILLDRQFTDSEAQQLWDSQTYKEHCMKSLHSLILFLWHCSDLLNYLRWTKRAAYYILL